MNGADERPAMVQEAHDRLAAAFLDPAEPFPNALAVAREFHAWAADNDRPVDLLAFREVHVRGIEPLGTETARLALAWLATVDDEHDG